MGLFLLQRNSKHNLSRLRCQSPSWTPPKKPIRLTSHSTCQHQKQPHPTLPLTTMLIIARLHSRLLHPCLRRLFLLARPVVWYLQAKTALRRQKAQHMSKRDRHRSRYRLLISSLPLPCACFSTHLLKICKRASRECGEEIWKFGVGAAAGFRFSLLGKVGWTIYGESGYSVTHTVDPKI